MYRVATFVLCFALGFACCFAQTKHPIRKADFVSSIKLGKRERKTAAQYIALVNELKVDFILTRKDKESLRRYGSYLGKTGIDNLIIAVRDNYGPSEQKPTPPTVSQTMTNSPGSIQAGGNVSINQGVQPRELTPEQEALLVKVLRENLKGSIDISCIESGGPEPCNFARQIARLMESREAGWKVNYAPLMFGAGDPTKTIPEVYILVKKGDVPYRARVLQSALKNVGVNAVGIEREDVAADFVQLTVWFQALKPIPSEMWPPKTIERISFSPEEISSLREDLPYGLSIIISSTVPISPIKMAVICDGPIGDASVGFSPPPGAVFFTSNIFGKATWFNENKMTFFFSITSPPLTPRGPLEVKLFSVHKIRVLEVKQLD